MCQEQDVWARKIIDSWEDRTLPLVRLQPAFAVDDWHHAEVSDIANLDPGALKPRPDDLQNERLHAFPVVFRPRKGRPYGLPGQSIRCAYAAPEPWHLATDSCHRRYLWSFWASQPPTEFLDPSSGCYGLLRCFGGCRCLGGQGQLSANAEVALDDLAIGVGS